MPAGSATLSLFRSDSRSPDIDHRELTRAGIVFGNTPTDESWPWPEAHFTDPAGNRLCLFHACENRRFPPWRLGHPQPTLDQS